VHDVVTDVVRFGQCEHDEVVAPPLAIACELVAFVSRARFAVDDAGDFVLEYCRTRFQTLITSRRSYHETAAFGSSCCRIETSVPNAGMMTMSSFCRSSMSRPSLCREELNAHGTDLVIHFRLWMISQI